MAAYAGGRLAFEFMVLTAARSNEVRGATWDQIEHDVLTIPASRMKGKREHRVPLSRRALEILEEARKLHDEGGIVFRSARRGGIDASMFGSLLRRLGVDGTPHEMRSSFRDWCSETGVAREVMEASRAGEQAPEPNAVSSRRSAAPATGSQVVSGCSGGISGKLRAVGSLLTRDRRPPSGLPGRAERGGAPGSAGYALVVRGAGEPLAEELVGGDAALLIPARRPLPGAVEVRSVGPGRGWLQTRYWSGASIPIGATRVAGPRQGLAGGCAPSDPPNGDGA